MTKRDYYEVLGIEKSATKDQIKSAYRKLAKKFHPDRNKEADAETKFKEIQEAYEVLSDERKRSAYDQYGHAGTQGFGGFNTSDFGGFDFGDLGGISDIFEQFFGGSFGGFSNARSRNNKSRGRDIETNLNITFDEAVFGTEKTINYKRHVTCNVCKGSGAKKGSTPETCKTCNGQGQVAQVQQTVFGQFRTVATCPTCHGEGKIIKEKCENCSGRGIEAINEKFKIKIPHGIPDGVSLRFTGQGDAGEKNGTTGDLYINIEVKAHKTLERRGNDIYTEITIDATSAVLGDKIHVDTVNGEKELVIPAGTQSETVLKMNNLGGPKFRGEGNGDQYVKVIVEIPKKLTKEQKQTWEKLKEMKNQKPGFIDKIFS